MTEALHVEKILNVSRPSCRAVLSVYMIVYSFSIVITVVAALVSVVCADCFAGVLSDGEGSRSQAAGGSRELSQVPAEGEGTQCQVGQARSSLVGFLTFHHSC